MSDLARIASALGSSDPEERRRAVALLAEHDAELTIEHVIRALGDDDWRVRKEAVQVAVAAVPSQAMLRALVEALGPGDNVGLRNAAVEAIGGYGIDAVEALSLRMNGLDADGKKLAAEALARTGQPTALLVLSPLLRDPDPNVRAAGLEAVAGVGVAGAKEAVPLLMSCLQDTDPFLRLAALDGINQLGAVLPFERVLALSRDPMLERAAIVAAGQSGDPRASELLVGAIERSRGSTLKQALIAVVQLARQKDSALPALRAAAASLSPAARQRIVELAAQAEDIPLAAVALPATGALCFEEVAGVAARALADERLLGAADEALGLLGPSAIPALVEYSRRAEPDARAACFELLARLADSERAGLARGEILAALADESPEVVRAALGALAAVGDTSCFAPVAMCLDPERPQLVRTAAENAICSLAAQFPEAARGLASGARPAGVDAHAAALVIATLGSPIRGSVEADVEFLSSALSNGLGPLRRASIEALAAVGSTLGVDVVAFALTDEEPDVRLAAVRALGRLRAPDGTIVGLSHLLSLVESPADSELFAAALQALGEAGDPHSLPILRPIVRSGDPPAAVAAIEALASFPGARRVEALIDGLSHSDTEVVKAAMRALSDAADPRVLVHLGACLDHEGWDVRRLAADLLSVTGDAATGLLGARLRIEDNPLVKDAINRALEQMSGVRRTPPPARGSWRPR